MCALTWNLLFDGVGANANANANGEMEFEHLLWGLLFLKTHGKESVMALAVGVQRTTFRKWSWQVIFHIAGLRREVVSGDGCFFFSFCERNSPCPASPHRFGFRTSSATIDRAPASYPLMGLIACFGSPSRSAEFGSLTSITSHGRLSVRGWNQHPNWRYLLD